jgi:hypothetical protein
MKKKCMLSYLLVPILFLHLTIEVFSQNVGIGLTNPTRAKLEVNGAVDYTSAIFGGESTGIGIIRNNPGIGFNNYYSGGNRYIANGYCGTIWLDAVNGAMFFDINGYGTANTISTTGINSMVINKTGNVAIRTYQAANASLYVLKAGNSDGAAVFGGTAYSSFFDYGTTEDTYIRGGKNSSTVIINDIPGGNIQLGYGNSKVAINTVPLASSTSLDVNGGLSLHPGVFTITSANRTITVGDKSFISIYNGSQPSAPNLVLTNGLTTGQVLIIHADMGNGTSGFDITENGFAGNFSNTDVNGTGFRMNANNTMSFIWTGVIWVELSRSNNAQ